MTTFNPAEINPELETAIRTQLGVGDDKLQAVSISVRRAGADSDLVGYLEGLRVDLGQELFDRLFAAHPFPYRTIRLCLRISGKHRQVRDVIDSIDNSKLAQLCDLAERYSVQDTNDWLRWAEALNIQIRWVR